MFVFRLDDFYALLWLVLSSCFHIFFRISSRLKLFLTNLISNSKITCQLLAIWSVIPYKLTPHTHTHTHTHTSMPAGYLLNFNPSHPALMFHCYLATSSHLLFSHWLLRHISQTPIRFRCAVRFFFFFSETGRSATWEGRRVSRR